MQKNKILAILDILGKPKILQDNSAASQPPVNRFFEFHLLGLFKGNTKNSGYRSLIYRDLDIGTAILNSLLDIHGYNKSSNHAIFTSITRMEEQEDLLKIDQSITMGSNLGGYFSKQLIKSILVLVMVFLKSSQHNEEFFKRNSDLIFNLTEIVILEGSQQMKLMVIGFLNFFIKDNFSVLISLTSSHIHKIFDLFGFCLMSNETEADR